MMSCSLSLVSDRLQALTRALDADLTLPGRMLIYSEARPASGQPPAVGALLLGTVHFPRPSLYSVAQNVLTLNNPLPVLVQYTGLAVWARLVNGAGQYIADVDVGIGDEEVLILDENGYVALTAQLYAGGELSVALARLTEV